MHKPAPAILVMADRAHDTNAIRKQIEDQGAVPNIPPKPPRPWKSRFSRVLYRDRIAIKRMFRTPKDYRRIATRYDSSQPTPLAPSTSPQPSPAGYESRP